MSSWLEIEKDRSHDTCAMEAGENVIVRYREFNNAGLITHVALTTVPGAKLEDGKIKKIEFDLDLNQ